MSKVKDAYECPDCGGRRFFLVGYDRTTITKRKKKGVEIFECEECGGGARKDRLKTRPTG
jgi:predicted RNA-binding Zn-ribbon protein involved in translation (DUF1610 family)